MSDGSTDRIRKRLISQWLNELARKSKVFSTDTRHDATLDASFGLGGRRSRSTDKSKARSGGTFCLIRADKLGLGNNWLSGFLRHSSSLGWCSIACPYCPHRCFLAPCRTSPKSTIFSCGDSAAASGARTEDDEWGLGSTSFGSVGGIGEGERGVTGKAAA
ncbi:hypothetical protein [Vibrio penaeicida]|uniref:hypothetical protein n=1 Tax=Vibrio penaeicida TaxID=104609 RepID=UPI001CC58615|nr:hypothetical protein [Vibrio penaeicida]